MAHQLAVANINLTDAQRAQLAHWIEEGLKVSDIQKRLETELGLRLTYMEVRFLLDDLRIMPKDQAPPVTPATDQAAKTAAPAPSGQGGTAKEPAADEADLPGTGAVKLTVDQIARPGAVASGTVTFSDGQSGTWYVDEMGRLGLGMKKKGYRPAAADLEEFQFKLQQELARQGF